MTDKNKNANFFMDHLMPYFLSSVNCFQVAKVVKIDGNEADCQPLTLQSDGDKRAMLISCPILASAMYYPKSTNGAKLTKLKKGDKVLIGFHDRDLDNYTGKEFKLASRRMHSLNDGIVLGVIV